MEGTQLAGADIEDIFSRIIACVKTIDPANARKWFDELKIAEFNGGLLKVGCPDKTIVEFLNDNCKSSFTRAAQQVTGHLVTVEFCLFTTAKKPVQQAADGGLKLHPDYTFENFVVGPSNRLAHASCVSVSKSPGKNYNPLFIYGSSGLGKTHLLHAVCHETQNLNSKMAIQLLSCEEFVNKFISAIEQGSVLDFQKQLRSVDMLVIDDVQFLREREQSQEEFFHTFNALYQHGKQIILSADCAPVEIPSLEERLISRFTWGLVTRIDVPSHDTRVAIVQKKAHLRGIEISEQVADYIAKKAQLNIRQIEGALTTVYALSTTSGSAITIELAKQALEGHSDMERHISFTDITDVVTEFYRVRLADLQSKKRSQSITLPRQVCMYLARNLTRHSLEEIGGHLGGRDHTTVMHACTKIVKMKKKNTKFKTALSGLEKQITQPVKR